MKTIINRRFLIGLIVGSLLFGAAVHGLHAIQINRQSRFLLDEAHRAQGEKQFEVALNRFQQYTKLAPEDMDAQAEFGLLLADRHWSQQAAITLEKVLRNKPERDDLRHRLVDVEMEIGRYRDAADHLQQHLLVTAPRDGSLLERLGTCQIGLGEFAAAGKSLDAAIGLDKHLIEAYVRLADVRRRLNDPQEADKKMQKLTEANPNSARAHVLRGEYLLVADPQQPGKAPDTAAALREAERAIELEPKDPAALLLAARLVAAKQDFAKGRAYTQRAIDAAPGQAAGYITLARIERFAGDRKKAVACLEKGVAATAPKNGALLWELGRLRIEAGELAEAQSVIDQMRTVRAEDRQELLIGYLEAEIEFANRHWQQAIQRFEEVAPELIHSPELLREARYQVAICHGNLGNTELQLAAYREAVRVDPNWPPARLGLASTLYTLGKLDEALEEYRHLSKLDGMAADGAANVVRLLIIKNLALTPVEQDWSEVNTILNQLVEKNPDAVGLTLLKADALVGQSKFTDADKLLLAARAKAPQSTDLWSFLVALAVRQKQWDRAAELLDEAAKQFGDQVWLRLVKSSYIVARDPQQSVPQLKAIGEKAGSFPDDDRLRLYSGLAVLSLRTGEIEQAAVFARQAGAADPKNLAIRRLLFECAWQSKDEAAAQRALREIKELEGESAYWQWGQAALCVLAQPPSAAADDAAFRHLAEASKLRPGWASVPLLKAKIQDRQGESTPALQGYLEAIELGERGPTAIRRTVELLNSRQRYAEADQIIRRLEQQPTLVSNDLERLASEVSVRLDNLERALLIARKVAAGSDEWRDHVWLGELEMLVGLRARATDANQAKEQLAAAEQSLLKANGLKIEAPEPWVALIRFYVATDRKPEAEATIQRAQRALPQETSALALAICYDTLGNQEEAGKRYSSALAKNKQDPLITRRAIEFFIRTGRLKDAETSLRPIVSGQNIAKPDEIAWARRALASVLRRSGSYPKLQEALRLVEQNLASRSPQDRMQEDQLEKAFILAAIPETTARKHAIQILEQLLPSQSDATGLRLVLAELYLAEKNSLQSLKYLRELMTTHERDPSYMALYVARLLQRQETAEAGIWIPRLEQLAPSSFSTASVKAEWLVQNNRFDDAIGVLRAYPDQPADKSADRAVRLIQIATAFEEIAHGPPGADRSAAAPKLLAEAEGAFRELVKQQPERTAALVIFLGRRGRFDEALALLETTAVNAAPETVAAAAGGLLNSGLIKTEQLTRLEKLLLAEAEQHDQPVAVFLVLADLRTAQARNEDAAAYYREVLKKDSNNVAAMNNLAVLLALQKKHLEESISLIDRAITLAGPLPTLLDSRATVYLALGKPQEALVDFDSAVREEPRANRQFHRALAYWRLGQKQAATAALGAAQNLGLKVENLNVLERPDYRELVANLKP